LRSALFTSIAAWLIAVYIRFVGVTTKWKVIRGEILEKEYFSRPFIMTFWHGRTMMIPYCAPRGLKASVLSSRHGDGQLMAKVQQNFGYNSIYGSSYVKGKDKGGSAAIRGMIRAKQRGELIGITPDGPHGPPRKVNGQVVEIAKMLKLPIIPVMFSCTRHKIAKSWDSFMFARPFGKGVFVVGEPMTPENNHELEVKMNMLIEEADIAVKTL